MSDFIQRFRDRKVVSPEVTFLFNGFEFRVARFAQAEANEARRAARGILRAEANTNPTPSEMGIAYMLAVAPVIARHVKGWKHDSPDPIPFNKANLDGLIASMEEAELAGFAMAFEAAALEDAQKKTNPAPSGLSFAERDLDTKSNARNQPAEAA